MQEARLLNRLQQGLDDMDLSVDASQCKQLVAYVLLLDKWNKAFNLSAVRDPLQMISRHILDSLSLHSRFVTLQKNENHPLCVLDVGTGPGLPGIPLAICFPAMKFYLLDSNGKKTRFLFQSVLSLGLGNVNVENCRIESYQCPDQLDIVVSRAFSSLADFVSGCEPVCRPTTRLLAMKGVYPVEELSDLPANWHLVHAERLDVPGCEGERHIVELMKMQAN